MQLGLIGLGRMGDSMAQRFLKGGHGVVGFDRDRDAGSGLTDQGGIRAASLGELMEKLSRPRAVWIMVPAGPAVDQTVQDILPHLSSGDMVLDGGNSFYKESVERAAKLEEKGVDWLDVGTSGGIWGLKEGYCLMIGGKKEAFIRLEPLFKTLAPEQGYLYCGRSGSGHFTKMVHNGIEYGMLQAYAEGFDLLKASPYQFDLKSVAELWTRGSVVRSWLLELAVEAFKKDPLLAGVKGYVEDSGEGRWLVREAVDLGIPAPVISLSLMERFHSRRKDSFGARVIAALRKEFGGHPVKKTGESDE